MYIRRPLLDVPFNIEIFEYDKIYIDLVNTVSYQSYTVARFYDYIICYYFIAI